MRGDEFVAAAPHDAPAGTGSTRLATVTGFLPMSHQAVTDWSHAPPASMDFGSWTDQRLDTLRIRRLVVGWVVGAVSVVSGMSFIVLTSKGVAASEEEDEGPIEVQLAKEPEPEPPPPPPPPPEAAKAAPKPRMVAPTTVSDEKLQ